VRRRASVGSSMLRRSARSHCVISPFCKVSDGAPFRLGSSQGAEALVELVPPRHERFSLQELPNFFGVDLGHR
jgi:hypothetical protein